MVKMEILFHSLQTKLIFQRLFDCQLHSRKIRKTKLCSGNDLLKNNETYISTNSSRFNSFSLSFEHTYIHHICIPSLYDHNTSDFEFDVVCCMLKVRA